MGNINWILISGIFAGLENLICHHNWSMSVGENAQFSKTVYNYLVKGCPKDIESIHQMFNAAYAATWGADHECEKTSKAELEIFLYSISDYFKDEFNGRISYIDHVNRLLDEIK